VCLRKLRVHGRSAGWEEKEQSIPFRGWKVKPADSGSRGKKASRAARALLLVLEAEEVPGPIGIVIAHAGPVPPDRDGVRRPVP